MLATTDTIVAPATAQGGALMVIRLSGSRAVEIADQIFRGKTPLAQAAGHSVHFGVVGKPEAPLDEVVATLFRAPRSYTGEDTVEFSCHGSAYITGEVVRMAIEAGARMAEPGEFTRRAYLAGKMDLAEAEAVADLIASESRAAHHLAMQQMRGGYSSALDGLRDELLSLTALLELELDFGEEDVTFADRSQIEQTMQRIGNEINRLRDSFRLGNAIKEGIPVAIVGAPNVGKSTLLNRLLGEERAMVSEIAGTTRDVIEECLTLGGIRFRLLDTAGLRHTDDRLEQMGIDRTRQSLERADVVIRLIDATTLEEGILPDNEFKLRDDQTCIIVANKTDLCPTRSLPEGVIALSAKEGRGVEKLCERLLSVVPTSYQEGATIVSSLRHYEALTVASKALESALQALHNDLPTDLLSEDIRSVISAISTITGRGAILPDEVLGHLFAHFCIGK